MKYKLFKLMYLPYMYGLKKNTFKFVFPSAEGINLNLIWLEKVKEHILSSTLRMYII